MAFPNGYTFRRLLTVDHTKVSGSANLSNFPVLVSELRVDFKDVGNGGDVQNPSGNLDIRFETTGGVKLDHEVERWVNTTGELIAWVRIPTLDFDDPTEFYVYYGNAGLGSSEQSVAATWASYVHVPHMHNAASPATDSKSGNNGTANGTVTFGATGKVGAGIDFATGNGNYLDFGDLTILDTLTVLYTEGWVKFDTLGTSRRLWGKWEESWLLSEDDTNSDELIIGIWDSANALTVFTTTDADLTTGVWYHVVVGWSAAGTKFVLINGVSKTLSTALNNATDIKNSTSAMRFGGQATASPAIDGILDEVRHSSTLHSTDWGITSYNSQNDPGTSFYSVGSEETSSSAIAAIMRNYRMLREN